MLVSVMALTVASPTGAVGADLILEGGGERLVVPGERLDEVFPTRDYQGGAAVQFRLSRQDATAFHDLTSRLVGQPLAVIVCGKEMIRPIVREPIAGGVGLITQDSYRAALTLAARLRGEAPCPETGS